MYLQGDTWLLDLKPFVDGLLTPSTMGLPPDTPTGTTYGLSRSTQDMAETLSGNLLRTSRPASRAGAAITMSTSPRLFTPADDTYPMLSHAKHEQIEAETTIMALRQELSEIHKTVAVEVSLRKAAEAARDISLDELERATAVLADASRARR